MKTFRRMISIAAAAVISMTSLSALSFTETASAASAAASFSYPVQEFRMGIGDTNCNINITGTESGDYLNGWTINGTDNEKWYLNYISEGVYEIVNTATGYVITNDSGLAVISPDTDAANQRWKISCVEKDFEGYELYFKIVSNADSNKALTFNIDSNSIQVSDYTGDIYQKFRLNLDGLEGYAANCSIGGKMKAGTIGGLLGETKFVDTNQELIDALNSTKPMTVVLTADLDLATWDKRNQRIRDNKTLIGSYSKNTLYDCQLRNDDFNGNDAAPSNNIVIRNMNFVARTLNSTGSGVILLQFYGARNLWVDHCDFSATFSQNKDKEVGKFIWINTPSTSWSDGVYNGINPDYITISYNYFKNRYWTVAYGSQNKDTSRLRTTMMFNKWEQCSRRCPQYSNGYHHNYSSYHTVTGSSNSNASSQVIGGEGSRILSENNRFEAYTGKEFDMDKNSNLSFHDYNSYTSKTVGGTPSKCSTSSRGTAWNAYDSYGYCLVEGYNTNGTDVKDFCNAYSGCFNSYSKIKYITDDDMSKYVSQRHYDPFLKDIEVGDDPVYGKQGAVLDTTHTYMFCNVNSGLYLEVADSVAKDGANVQQGSTNANCWNLEDAGDGYYRVYSEVGDGKTYLLDVADGGTDNGTNIAIWSNTACDAQLFKFVLNEDGSYTITTKVTRDKSAVGVAMGSKDEGMTVVQWECNGSDDQKWNIEIKIDPINGNLIQDLIVKDTASYKDWSIDTDIQVGDLVFGDREEVTYASLPEEIVGAEAIITACDAKTCTNDLAAFTAGADMTVYAAFDERVDPTPLWLSSWTKTEMTATNSKGVTFRLYALEVKAGDTVTLGANGQSQTCVNYTVFAVKKAAVTTTTTTTTATTTTTTTTTTTDTTTTTNVTTTAPEIGGDINNDGTASVLDIVALQKHLLDVKVLDKDQHSPADMNKDGRINVFDLVLIKKLIISLNQ